MSDLPAISPTIVTQVSLPIYVPHNFHDSHINLITSIILDQSKIHIKHKIIRPLFNSLG